MGHIPRDEFRQTRLSIFWHVVVLLAVGWSAWRPADSLTWWLEIAPVACAYLAVVITWRAFPLTPLSSWLLAFLMVIIAIGAHYGFGAVPWFEWLRLQTGGARNNFDKVAHFFQGFVPAILIREILVRFRVTPHSAWLSALTVALSLALSALYELFEWLMAVLLAERADSFIADQGDRWDAQTDMGLALLGSILMVGLLSRRHDQQIQALRRLDSASGTRIP